MTGALLRTVPLRYQIGERTLASVSRRLVAIDFTLDDVLAEGAVALPPLPADADGYLLRSVPLARLPDAVAQAGGLLVYVRENFPRHYASLGGSFDAYLAGFGGKTRSTLNRKSRKFAELSGGALDIREYRSAADLAEFHALARQVSSRTYQERLLDAGLPDEAGFHADLAARGAEDRARGYLLFLDGAPVSYLYTPIDDGRVIYAYLGYDPAVAVHSAGTVLQLEAMKRLFAEGRYRLFDFTEGDGQHKRQFATGQVDCANVLLLRPTAAHRLLVASHRGFNAFVARGKQLAADAGFATRLKRLLRG